MSQERDLGSGCEIFANGSFAALVDTQEDKPSLHYVLVSREDRAVSVLGGARLDAVFWVSDSVLGCVDGGRMVIVVSRHYYYLYS